MALLLRFAVVSCLLVAGQRAVADAYLDYAPQTGALWLRNPPQPYGFAFLGTVALHSEAGNLLDAPSPLGAARPVERSEERGEYIWQRRDLWVSFYPSPDDASGLYLGLLVDPNTPISDLASRLAAGPLKWGPRIEYDLEIRSVPEPSSSALGLASVAAFAFAFAPRRSSANLRG
jgi:hypothetical protein